jgi:hypothetical protein
MCFISLWQFKSLAQIRGGRSLKTPAARVVSSVICQIKFKLTNWSERGFNFESLLFDYDVAAINCNSATVIPPGSKETGLHRGQVLQKRT